MPLTDVSVRKAKGRATAYKLADGGGLYVLVRSSDARYWRMDYRWGGKRRTLALGVYPMVSLAEAREKRNQAKKLLASGIDPSAQRKLERLVAKAAADNTFRLVSEEWLGKLAKEGRAPLPWARSHGCLNWHIPRSANGRWRRSRPPNC